MEQSILPRNCHNMIFDTHTHCYFESLAPHIERVIAEMRANGIQYATQIGCDI